MYYIVIRLAGKTYCGGIIKMGICRCPFPFI